METFGSRLRGLREARGWSQEKLGFELELTGATISKWENNRAEPGLTQLTKLRHIFLSDGVTLDWLIDTAVSVKGMAAAWVALREGRGDYEASPRLAESAEEMAVLIRFRRMDSKRRKALLEILGDDGEESNGLIL